MGVSKQGCGSRVGSIVGQFMPGLTNADRYGGAADSGPACRRVAQVASPRAEPDGSQPACCRADPPPRLPGRADPPPGQQRPPQSRLPQSRHLGWTDRDYLVQSLHHQDNPREAVWPAG